MLPTIIFLHNFLLNFPELRDNRGFIATTSNVAVPAGLYSIIYIKRNAPIPFQSHVFFYVRVGTLTAQRCLLWCAISYVLYKMKDINTECYRWFRLIVAHSYVLCRLGIFNPWPALKSLFKALEFVLNILKHFMYIWIHF